MKKLKNIEETYKNIDFYADFFFRQTHTAICLKPFWTPIVREIFVIDIKIYDNKNIEAVYENSTFVSSIKMHNNSTLKL